MRKLDRRDLLLMATGSAAGLLFSPLPWKLLDDLAIDSQHSRLAPEPPRGEVTFRFTACTLCPAGCALKARCVGGRPVSFTGVRQNPISRGALCATGLLGHHLLAHPRRLTRPSRVVWQGTRADFGNAPLDEVIADAVGAMKATRAPVPLALLDLRPGRMATIEARRLLASLPGAVVALPRPGADATLAAMRQRIEGNAGPLGVDLARTRTVAGFGAPLREGWGAPAHAAALVSGTPRARHFQVEPYRSPSAEGADRWLPIRPGTEAALALGVAHVVLRDGLVMPGVLSRARDLPRFRTLASPFDPAAVERLTGVPPARTEELARALLAGPAVVLGGGSPGAEPLGRDAEAAIAALNILLGSLHDLGRDGGVVLRRNLPAPASGVSLAPEVPLDSLADASVGVLVLDAAPGEALSWNSIAPKLAPGAVVVSLSPWLAGAAERANWAVPGPAPLETLVEVLPAPGAPATSWGLAPALLPPTPGATEPLTFLSKLLAAAGARPPEPASAAALVLERAAAISAVKRGRLHAPGGSEEPVPDASALVVKLTAGAVWIDDPLPAPHTSPRFSLLLDGDAERLERLAAQPGPSLTTPRPPRGYVGADGALPEPLLLVKLGAQSHLRTAREA